MTIDDLVKLKGDRSGGSLGLRYIADRLDDSDSHDWCNIDGPRDGAYPSSVGEQEPPRAAPGARDQHRSHRYGGAAPGSAPRDRGCAMGGGILVARRTQLAGRSAPLFCRFDEHARRFGASARAALADDGRT